MKTAHRGFLFKPGTYEGVVRSAERTVNHSGQANVVKVSFTVTNGFKTPKVVNRNFYLDGNTDEFLKKDGIDLRGLFQLLTPMNYNKSLHELVGKRVRFDIRTVHRSDGTSFNQVCRFTKSRYWDPLAESRRPEPATPPPAPVGWGFQFGNNKPTEPAQQ